MASTDATPIAIKNQAYRVVFPIWDADGDVVTGAAGLDSEISKDQGAFTDCTNEATEIATASGIYYLDLSSTEMNADCVSIIIKTSTVGAKTTVLVIYPAEQNDIRVNVVAINSTAAATPGASGGILISGTNSGTTTLGALTVTGATTLTGNVALAAGLNITQSSSNTSAIVITGNGTGHGISVTSGSGATGNGINVTSSATNGHGYNIAGAGTGNGWQTTGGSTGNGVKCFGGAVSGDGINTIGSTSGHGIATTGQGTSKHGINAVGTDASAIGIAATGGSGGSGISATGGGTGHGILATSGSGATGDGIRATTASTAGNGLNLIASGTGSGLLTTGGGTGHGISSVGGATSGDGFRSVASTSGHGITATGVGTTRHGINATGGSTTSAGISSTGGGAGAGFLITAGATGTGLSIVGGGTSGAGISVTTTSGDGFSITPTAGSALVLTGNGTSKHGAIITGGTAGTSDGLSCVAGTGGVPIRGNITGNITGNLSGSIGSLAADSITSTALATSAVDEIVDAVWDEVLTGATHNVTNSAGKRLREQTNAIVSSDTAQGGSTNTITLSTNASSTDGTYDPALVRISGGTGAGQARLIIHYTGSTRVAVVDRDWRTAPDNTSVYEIVASPNLMSTNEGLAQAGASTSITLNASASSTDDVYKGQTVVIRTGTGQDQSRIISAYNGTTKVATVAQAWVTNPSSSSGYMILPTGRSLMVSAEADSITNSSFASGTIVNSNVSKIDSSTSAATNAKYFWEGAAQTGTAQAGGASTITLAAGASSTDSYYNSAAITIVDGTGEGQTRKISSYVGATRVATVDAAWTTNPDNTSVYQVIGRIV